MTLLSTRAGLTLKEGLPYWGFAVVGDPRAPSTWPVLFVVEELK